MNCETLGRHRECKANFNFEHCHTTKPQRNRGKQLGPNSLKHIKDCKNSTETNLQVHQCNFTNGLPIDKWNCTRTCGHWTVNRETLNKEQCTMRGTICQDDELPWIGLPPATCPTCQNKQTLHQMNCATLAGTMNAKPTSTLNIFMSTIGHAAGNFFPICTWRTHLSSCYSVDFQENMSGNLVPQRLNEHKTVEQCTGNSAQVQSVQWTTAHSVQLMPIAQLLLLVPSIASIGSVGSTTTRPPWAPSPPTLPDFSLRIIDPPVHTKSCMGHKGFASEQ